MSEICNATAGVIDLISVIPKEGLNPKGINYIAAMILYYCAEEL